MNAWFLTSVIILIVAVVILVGCIVAVMMPLKKTIVILLAHVEGIQKQLNGILVQITALNKTVDRMKVDIEFKKTSIQGVIQSVKDTSDVLNGVSESTEREVLAIIKYVNNDTQKQAQAEQWTNRAIQFLNRKAN